MADFKAILTQSIKKGASDVHFKAKRPPIVRINTKLMPMDLPVMTDQVIKEMMIDMVGPDRFKIFEEQRDLDFSVGIDDGSRFRVNAHYQRDTIAISFRIIPNKIPDIEKLNLPPIVRELISLPRGLVLVTGHTGCGKSTTLAGMIGAINKNYNKHIITLEDPIEYLFEDDKCIIEQRDIGQDCLSFAKGLRHALRQDPDILLVGEMRDLETTSATISAAETGHLVFSTLHTVNATQSVERIIDIYPAGQQPQIRSMLANNLQAVISQTLFPRIDKPGMVPCVEILISTSAVRSCIRDKRIFELPNFVETSRRIGMQSLNHSIAEMCFRGFIDKKEAIARSSDPRKMREMLADLPKETKRKRWFGAD